MLQISIRNQVTGRQKQDSRIDVPLLQVALLKLAATFLVVDSCIECSSSSSSSSSM